MISTLSWKLNTIRNISSFKSDSWKLGEKITELAARIRQDTSTCNPAIKNMKDEAMRTHFICAVKNEAVLKAVFKLWDDELTLSKAVEVAQEIEEATKLR